MAVMAMANRGTATYAGSVCFTRLKSRSSVSKTPMRWSIRVGLKSAGQ